MGIEKYTPNRARFFVRKKYRSVKKNFPESYDFTANLYHATTAVKGSSFSLIAL
jgi:hypothetical protein